ncbi:MAG TPA: HAD family hydrolase [Verrucomicrobiae bacterium]|jgi:hypothetical protein
MALKLISTDFDGTLFAEFENPPVPEKLQKLICGLQAGGATWVINTGRDLSSLLETLGRSHLTIKPDFVVIVEREIYRRNQTEFVEDKPWNKASRHAHAELFHRVHGDLPRLRAWVESRFKATIYEDIFSPFCFIAESFAEAEVISEYLGEYCKGVPNLAVVRNDVYARLSHEAFNKGTALAEIGRQLGISADQTFAVGDHLNDVPMLSRKYARWLGAPSNAIVLIKSLVSTQEGHVSELHCGHGVAEALEVAIRKAGKVG